MPLNKFLKKKVTEFNFSCVKQNDRIKAEIKGVIMKNRKRVYLFVLLAIALTLSFSSCLLDFEWGWPEEDSGWGGSKTEHVYKKSGKEEPDESEQRGQTPYDYSSENENLKKENEELKKKISELEENINSSKEQEKPAEEKQEPVEKQKPAEEKKEPVEEQKPAEEKQEPAEEQKPAEEKQINTRIENLVTVTTVGKDDISITWKKTEDGVTFSVPEEYACKWYEDGILFPNSNGNEFTMLTSIRCPGVHNIMVVAEKDGFVYSSHINLVIE